MLFSYAAGLPSRSSSLDFVISVVERLNGKDFDVMRSTTVTAAFSPQLFQPLMMIT